MPTFSTDLVKIVTAASLQRRELLSDMSKAWPVKALVKTALQLDNKVAELSPHSTWRSLQLSIK